jgi:hypothetical protein
MSPWSWALLGKLPDAQLLKNFPAFYGTPKVHHRVHLSWAKVILHYIILKSNLILSSHLCLGLGSAVFRYGSPAKILYSFLLFSTRATCSAHLILFYLIFITYYCLHILLKSNQNCCSCFFSISYNFVFELMEIGCLYSQCTMIVKCMVNRLLNTEYHCNPSHRWGTIEVHRHIYMQVNRRFKRNTSYSLGGGGGRDVNTLRTSWHLFFLRSQLSHLREKVSLRLATGTICGFCIILIINMDSFLEERCVFSEVFSST